ncbi:MAG: glycosyl transferase family 2 [Eubacterium sp.]|nr:glycosyl transferase family 2 [Eubacterium sp.]
MDSSPLISVIIPMYNTRDYIEQTVKSVLSQTYKKLEVVIVDDGSTDDGSKIVEELKKNDSRIKYIYQFNQGVSAARNNAIICSSGEYLAFLDSDDLWKPHKLEKQMNRIMSTNMEACYCGYQMFCGDETGKVFPERYYEGSILPEAIKEKVSVWTSTVLIKKSIVTNNNINFRSGLNWSEDMEFFCKLMYLCDFCCVKETLALYRQRPNSLSVAPDRLPEIGLWMDFLDWLKAAPASKLYDKRKLEKAVKEYKLPSIAIFCLYQKLINGETPGGTFFSKVPSNLLYDFRPSLSSTGMKLLVKKLLIQYKYGYKRKAGT